MAARAGRSATPYRNVVVLEPLRSIEDRHFSHSAPPDARWWAEGPSARGRVGLYLVRSDIPNNIHMALVSGRRPGQLFSDPSHTSNGSTFDFQARELSCEHLNRRVVRYAKYDRSITAIADAYNGQRLNSPTHFSRPPDGASGSHGSAAAQRARRLRRRLWLKLPLSRGAPCRPDPPAELATVTDERERANGLCFSPDY